MSSFLFTGNQDGPQQYVCVRGTQIIPRSIREWHLHAPYMLFSLVITDLVWSNQMACFHTLSKLKVATRDGSSRDYPGMFRLVQAVNRYDLRFEIENSTQNE